VKTGEKITQAIQVCYNLTEENKNREINGLTEALETFNLSEGLILTFNQQDTIKNQEKNIKITPVWQWLKNDPLTPWHSQN